MLERPLAERGWDRPPQRAIGGGWAPAGTARIAHIVPEQEGFEPELGGREVPQGIFAGAGEIAHSFIFHRGDIDGGQIPRAHQAGQLDRVTTVGCHAVAGLFGNA